MAQRIYVGPHDEVDIPALNVTVRRGDAVEVDAEQAKTLDEQPSNWAKPNTNAAKEADK